MGVMFIGIARVIKVNETNMNLFLEFTDSLNNNGSQYFWRGNLGSERLK